MPTALVLTAHGDDMEFFAGGTVALLCERGWDVHVLLATEDDVIGFRQASEAAGLSVATCNRRIAALASFFRFLTTNGHRSDTPIAARTQRSEDSGSSTANLSDGLAVHWTL